jgi:hypothetical protein
MNSQKEKSSKKEKVTADDDIIPWVTFLDDLTRFVFL